MKRTISSIFCCFRWLCSITMIWVELDSVEHRENSSTEKINVKRCYQTWNNSQSDLENSTQPSILIAFPRLLMCSCRSFFMWKQRRRWDHRRKSFCFVLVYMEIYTNEIGNMTRIVSLIMNLKMYIIYLSGDSGQ